MLSMPITQQDIGKQVELSTGHVGTIVAVDTAANRAWIKCTIVSPSGPWAVALTGLALGGHCPDVVSIINPVIHPTSILKKDVFSGHIVYSTPNSNWNWTLPSEITDTVQPVQKKTPLCWPGSHVFLDTGMTLTFCKICDCKARVNPMDGSVEIIPDEQE